MRHIPGFPGLSDPRSTTSSRSEGPWPSENLSPTNHEGGDHVRNGLGAATGACAGRNDEAESGVGKGRRDAVGVDAITGGERAGAPGVGGSAVVDVGTAQAIEPGAAPDCGVASVGDEKDARPLKYGLPRKGHERGVYVYIANDFPFFKVGSSRQLRLRLTSLKWVMPGGMRLLAWWPIDGYGSARRLDVELDIQARLERFSAQGEWFRADPEALALVAKWQERRPSPAKVPDDYRFSAKRRRRWLAEHYAEISR